MDGEPVQLEQSVRDATSRRVDPAHRHANATLTLWLEAERFDDYGGWCNDPQFIETMGSPYLLAAGVGKPVQDAVTRLEVEQAGAYRLWVRCKDWHPSHSPGKFQVLVANEPSTVTFGQADTDEWQWVDGGEFQLEVGSHEVRLRDLTGWWGRCDALVLSSDPDFKPSNDNQELADQRCAFGGVSPELQYVDTFDVVVVGGGLAGVLAAVSAARLGQQVALVQDRPVLGGNASTEIQVPVQGDLTYEPWDPRETGLIEEFDPKIIGKGPWSKNLERIARAEPNLRLWLNTKLTGVEMESPTRIKRIQTINVISGQRLQFEGRQFVDASGDAWLGYWAGAEYRHGQESRDEHGESIAPETSDGQTQSTSINTGRFAGRSEPVEFAPPEWAYRWNAPEDFEPRSMGAVWNNSVRVKAFDEETVGRGRLPQHARAPLQEWYVEFGGRHNTIQDAEWIRDELFRISIGIWDYVKNRHPEYRKKNAKRELVWLNYVAGKRESRRLMGDHVLNQNDIHNQTVFPDTVAYAGWVMDIHHPGGFFAAGPQAHLEYMNRAAIPFRSLYSRNIDNLLMAGRNISTTHLALAKTRVMRTCALIGWAAGVGAALAVQHKTTPRGVAEHHVEELQQILLKGGAFLPGAANKDPHDLARRASVSASSYATIADDKYIVTSSHYFWNAKHPLECGLAVQFKASEKQIDSVDLFLRSERDEPTPITLTLRPSRWDGDLEAPGVLETAEAIVPPNSAGWVSFPLQHATDVGQRYVMSLPECKGLYWDLYRHHPPDAWRGYETKPGWSCEWGCHKFRLHPGGEPPASKLTAEHGPKIEFLPENLLNGQSRVVDGSPNSWAPDPEAPLPQWIDLEFPEPITFNEVHVSFQMNILAPRSYSIAVETDEGWKTVLRQTENRLRRRIHLCDNTITRRVRLLIEERSKTVEVPLTPVCQVRLYLQPRSTDSE